MADACPPFLVPDDWPDDYGIDPLAPKKDNCGPFPPVPQPKPPRTIAGAVRRLNYGEAQPSRTPTRQRILGPGETSMRDTARLTAATRRGQIIPDNPIRVVSPATALFSFEFTHSETHWRERLTVAAEDCRLTAETAVIAVIGHLVVTSAEWLVRLDGQPPALISHMSRAPQPAEGALLDQASSLRLELEVPLEPAAFNWMETTPVLGIEAVYVRSNEPALLELTLPPTRTAVFSEAAPQVGAINVVGERSAIAALAAISPEAAEITTEQDIVAVGYGLRLALNETILQPRPEVFQIAFALDVLSDPLESSLQVSALKVGFLLRVAPNSAVLDATFEAVGIGFYLNIHPEEAELALARPASPTRVASTAETIAADIMLAVQVHLAMPTVALHPAIPHITITVEQPEFSQVRLRNSPAAITALIAPSAGTVVPNVQLGPGGALMLDTSTPEIQRAAAVSLPADAGVLAMVPVDAEVSHLVRLSPPVASLVVRGDAPALAQVGLRLAMQVVTFDLTVLAMLEVAEAALAPASAEMAVTAEDFVLQDARQLRISPTPLALAWQAEPQTMGKTAILSRSPEALDFAITGDAPVGYIALRLAPASLDLDVSGSDIVFGSRKTLWAFPVSLFLRGGTPVRNALTTLSPESTDHVVETAAPTVERLVSLSPALDQGNLEGQNGNLGIMTRATPTATTVVLTTETSPFGATSLWLSPASASALTTGMVPSSENESLVVVDDAAATLEPVYPVIFAQLARSVALDPGAIGLTALAQRVFYDTPVVSTPAELELDASLTPFSQMLTTGVSIAAPAVLWGSMPALGVTLSLQVAQTEMEIIGETAETTIQRLLSPATVDLSVMGQPEYGGLQNAVQTDPAVLGVAGQDPGAEFHLRLATVVAPAELALSGPIAQSIPATIRAPAAPDLPMVGSSSAISVDLDLVAEPASAALTGSSSETLEVMVAAGHRYWRLYAYANSGNSTNAGLNEIQLRTTIGGPNVATGGVASGSGGTPAAAWDGDTGSAWNVSNAAFWTAYDFGEGNAKNIAEMVIYPSGISANRSPSWFSLSGSEDGINWGDIAIYGSPTGWVIGTPKTFRRHDLIDPPPARWWRVWVDQSMGNTWVGAQEIEFRGTPGGPDLTPVAGGVPIASHSVSGGAANAFDNSTAVPFRTDSIPPVYVGYDFLTPVTVNEVAWTSRSAQNPRLGWIQYSHDGQQWANYYRFEVTDLTWTAGTTKLFTYTADPPS